ncbi:penicillin-binding transpeptidase domain-containing protein [Nitrosomonas sp. Is35]|uniref:peptidoglycan D,D-transpeptidase FtsI family protein n=1 Tax=unclassified Nitrosomonas TaxID=2609265 RepID=UPI00294B903C|nr:MULTISPECIES: penicillin-binding transpeptidase domain-containing protein [unclassified Nitrosomonas]MDV6342863.1 penicillin-binding transpeptidase domain-containing protein [Nitrosomonas sp. Is24]MDV6348770.1 penicillin-binding transpeptidase domain-containing protein [Nitrosomonas sp. Is35]
MIKPEVRQIKLSGWRSLLLFGLLVLGLISLAGRAAYLQGMHHDFLQEKGESRYSRVVEMNADRGMITDRNGHILAISSPVASVYVDPKMIDIKPEQLKQLAGLLEMDSAEIDARIHRENSRFVYLKRQVVPDIADKIMKLKIKGIYFASESKRYYPESEFAAHVLGFTDINDEGQEGVERGWQDKLAGELGRRRVLKDNKGQIIEDVENIRPPKPGEDLVLSIDRRIQYRAHAELKEAVLANNAKAGSIVVLDAQTGEILALTNLPAYNPNRRSSITNERLRNRALIDTFEPGSTLKPFTVAIAMEIGKVNANTVLQTAPGMWQVGRKTIRDVSNKGELTVAQIIQQSSNVGTAKIALSLESQTMWEMFNRSGFGTLTNSGFPGEASGILRPYNKWRPIEQATMSYGHGISTSLMQLARAYTIFASGGELKPISLLKQNMPVMGQRVISRDTAQAMNRMLEMATKPGGTAPLAQISGYRVAGKTGTAHKLIDGQYANKRYISTFVGYAPASNPRLIIAVMIDEPSAGKYFGGAVAAPVFSNVMSGALRILNIPPDAPANNVVTFTATPEMGDEG